MSRDDRRRAQQLIGEVAGADEDVVALGEVVALALTVDPGLLRAARRAFFGSSRGPDLEADLWHSPLVASSNTTGFVLRPDVATELRIGLARAPARALQARELIERERAWLPDTLRLEEELRYLALVPRGVERARQLLARLDAALGHRDGSGLEPWREGLFARLPAELIATLGPPGTGPGRSGRRAEAPGPRAIGVRVLDGAVELRRYFAGTPAHRLPLPADAPALVHVDGRLVDVEDLPCRLPAGRRVEIEALDGSSLTARRRRRRRARPATMKGHTGGVWGVAFSPDGAVVASAGEDRTVRLWDAAGGGLRATLEGHAGGVQGVAFSPDGAVVASAASDGTVRLWDAARGALQATLEGHTGGVWAVAYSPDGSAVAAGGSDGTVRLWDAAGGGLRVTLAGHTGGVWGVAFSPDGAVVASAASDGKVRLWDAAGGGLRATLEGHAGGVQGVAFSPDGAVVASAASDGTVRLWDAAGGELRATLEGHAGTVWGVAFSPDGAVVASGGYDRTVRLWDVAGGGLRVTPAGHTGGVQGVAFSPDGAVVASCGNDRTVRLWDAAGGGLQATLEGHAGGVQGVAFSPDGAVVASCGNDRTVRLWDAAGGGLRAILEGHAGGVWGVAFSPDGAVVASGGYDRTVRLWDAAGGGQRATLEGHTDWVRAVAFSPDGAVVASAGDDGTVRLWDAAEGGLRATLAGHTDWVQGVAFSPDGAVVASAGTDRTVRLWDAAGGGLQATFEGHTGWVQGVAFSPDGAVVASGGYDRTVRLWDAAGGGLQATFEGHTGWVRGVAFSPDGTVVASGGADGTVRLWDAAGGGLWRVLGRPLAALLVVGDLEAVGALAGAVAALGQPGLWWSPAVGIGAGAIVAALVAAGGDEWRQLVTRPPRLRRLERALALTLEARRVRICGDLRQTGQTSLAGWRFHAAVVDVATDRCVVLPRDARGLGPDPDAIPVVALVLAAMAGHDDEPVEIGGRRFASTLAEHFDPRPWFEGQPTDEPAALVHVAHDAARHPRPLGTNTPPFLTVSIPDLRPARPRRLSRSRREVLALIGADAAHRAASDFRAREAETASYPVRPPPPAR